MTSSDDCNALFIGLPAKLLTDAQNFFYLHFTHSIYTAFHILYKDLITNFKAIHGLASQYTVDIHHYTPCSLIRWSHTAIPINLHLNSHGDM